jgi:hypothetical protein
MSSPKIQFITNENITAMGPRAAHGGRTRLIVKQFVIRDVAANHAITFWHKRKSKLTNLCGQVALLAWPVA